MKIPVDTTTNILDIVKNLPPDVIRVKVWEADGGLRWKEIADVCRSDTMAYRTDGQPIVMKGKLGRKKGSRKVIPSDAVPKQKLSTLVTTNPDSSLIIDKAMGMLADEIEGISKERDSIKKDGGTTLEYAVKLIRSLEEIGNLWLKRKAALEASTLDLDSPAFKVFFKEMLEAFRGSLDSSNIKDELAAVVMNRLSDIMDDGWETDLKAKIRNKVRGG